MAHSFAFSKCRLALKLGILAGPKAVFDSESNESLQVQFHSGWLDVLLSTDPHSPARPGPFAVVCLFPLEFQAVIVRLPSMDHR
jgi:hypothetical protein